MAKALVAVRARRRAARNLTLDFLAEGRLEARVVDLSRIFRVVAGLQEIGCRLTEGDKAWFILKTVAKAKAVAHDQGYAVTISHVASRFEYKLEIFVAWIIEHRV